MHETADVRGLALGSRVEIALRNGQLDGIAGALELASAPDFPWDRHQPLALRIPGFAFSSRHIECWTAIELGAAGGAPGTCKQTGNHQVSGKRDRLSTRSSFGFEIFVPRRQNGSGQ